jgi:acyl-CoA thioester hydrolase
VIDYRAAVAPHTITIEVRFSELDPYGHLNHAVYATFFETARVGALREVDLDLVALAAEGFQFVVTQLILDYKRPAVAHDVVTVTTEVAETRRASTVWAQRMLRGDEVLATAEVRSAITDTRGKPVRPPAWVLERLAPLVRS